MSNHDFYLVIGFGLNLQLDAQALAQIDQPAIGLNQVAEQAVDRQHLYKQLIATITRSVNDFNDQSIAPLLQQFKRLDRLLGQEVLVSTREQQLQGVYRGIARDGQIQIQTSDGLHSFAAAEISLRGQQHAAD